MTASGRAIVCNAREHPDLYWACRGGGGGNFGIVTVGSSGQFFGPEGELRSLLAPLRAVGSSKVTTASKTYIDAALGWAGCEGPITGCHLAAAP